MSINFNYIYVCREREKKRGVEKGGRNALQRDLYLCDMLSLWVN